jgi:hypothetical protein
MGQNTHIFFSCFACLGAPNLQGRLCRGGWNKNKEKYLISFS